MGSRDGLDWRQMLAGEGGTMLSRLLLLLLVVVMLEVRQLLLRLTQSLVLAELLVLLARLHLLLWVRTVVSG